MADEQNTPPTPPRPGFPLDRIASIILLVFLGFNVFGSLGSLLAFPLTLNALLEAMRTQLPGFPELTYTDTGLAEVVGIVLVTVSGLILGLIVWWTIRRLGAGKIAFWVPIVGYALMTVSLMIGELVCLLNDPAIMEALIAYSASMSTSVPSPNPSDTSSSFTPAA